MNIRVDNSSITEITRTGTRVEVKGEVAVETQKTTTQKVENDTGRVASIQQTTVETPHNIVGESQLDEIRQEAENMEDSFRKRCGLCLIR